MIIIVIKKSTEWLWHRLEREIFARLISKINREYDWRREKNEWTNNSYNVNDNGSSGNDSGGGGDDDDDNSDSNDSDFNVDEFKEWSVR